LSASGSSQSKSDELSTQTRLKQGLVAPKSLSREGQDDFIFSEQGKIYEKEHITFLASRTLPFLRALFESNADEQRRLILVFQDFGREHLGGFLESTLVSGQLWDGSWMLRHQNRPFEGDKLSACNLTWLWA
jgi:hypothetical protein